MKKTIFTISSLLLLLACTPKDTTAEKTKEANSTLDKDTVFSFDVSNIKSGCESNSDLICTINYAVKCTLNPQFDDCEKQKDKLPSFVFMQLYTNIHYSNERM